MGKNKVGDTNMSEVPNVNGIMSGKTNGTTGDIKSQSKPGIDTSESTYLSSDKRSRISKYFQYSTVISQSLGDYFSGIKNPKYKSKIHYDKVPTYDRFLMYFSWFIFLRNFLLAWIEDVQWRAVLGETKDQFNLILL